ncbi:unnamed protein product, partial [Gulo gulo]
SPSRLLDHDNSKSAGHTIQKRKEINIPEEIRYYLRVLQLINSEYPSTAWKSYL